MVGGGAGKGLLITASVSLGVMGLFKLFIWPWLTLVSGIYQEIYSFHFGFPDWWSIDVKVRPHDSQNFPGVCCDVPLLSLILLTWTFSLCLLVNLGKDLSVLLIFFKDQVFVSLIPCFSILLILALSLITSCCPITCFISSCSCF